VRPIHKATLGTGEIACGDFRWSLFKEEGAADAASTSVTPVCHGNVDELRANLFFPRQSALGGFRRAHYRMGRGSTMLQNGGIVNQPTGHANSRTKDA
jgi:hypothetical protein